MRYRLKNANVGAEQVKTDTPIDTDKGQQMVKANSWIVSFTKKKRVAFGHNEFVARFEPIPGEHGHFKDLRAEVTAIQIRGTELRYYTTSYDYQVGRNGDWLVDNGVQAQVIKKADFTSWYEPSGG